MNSPILKILLTTIFIFGSYTINAQQNISDSLQHQNYQRQYIVHLPTGYNNNNPTPAVIVLHGGSGNYQSVQGFTQMNFVSNQNDFLAVYPQGIGSAPPGYSWADGRNTTADQAGIDDVGFMSKLIDRLYNDYNIDTNRVYICGFSNGGFMTQRLACETPELFAAIGGLGCSVDINLIQTCNPNQAVPMAYFSGTADPEVPYNGGAMNNPTVTPIVSVDTAVQFWVNNNNCQTAEPVVNILDNVPEDSSTVELYKYTDCDCDADFYFYKIINGGHTWPGVPVPQFPQLGNTNEDIHASYLLWDFFSQFSLCDNITGVIENERDKHFSLYPNPTHGTIYFQSEEKITNVTLFDMIGQKRFLKKVNDGFIDLTNLSSGIYLLRIEFSNGKIQTTKVVKE
jgi:polyhydroxybutyrate depolymerase